MANEDDGPDPVIEDEGSEAEKNDKLGDIWKPMGRDWFQSEPPKRVYLLSSNKDDKGVLPLGKVGMVAGAGAAGKSWAMTALALSVASGQPWFGFNVDSPGRVLLILAEEEKEEAQRRFYWAAKAMNFSDEAYALASANILVLPMAGRPVTLTREIESNDEGELSTTLLFNEIKRRMTDGGEPWRLVVLDPLSRFAGADVEKENAAATRFVQALESLAHDAAGTPTVLVTHHTNKSERTTSEKQLTDSGMAAGARGSSALSDGVRWQANMSARPTIEGAPRIVDLDVVKNNYGPHGAKVTLFADTNAHGALKYADNKILERYEAAKAADTKSGPAVTKGKEPSPPRSRPNPFGDS